MAQYRAPTLFAGVANYKNEWELRDYLTDEMVAMAEAGTLSVTDLMNQEPRTAEICGQILLGHESREDGTMMQGQDVPSELADYMVKLKSINNAPSVYFKRSARMSGRAYRRRGSVAMYSAETAEVPFPSDGVLEMKLPEAWRVLRFCGANCRKVKRTTAQSRMWRCEEVKSGVSADGESPRRRRAANA